MIILDYKLLQFLIIIVPSFPPVETVLFLKDTLIQFDVRSWPSIYYIGGFGAVLDFSYTLPINYYGCLYFLNTLSFPVTNISPEGRTEINCWSESIFLTKNYKSNFKASPLLSAEITVCDGGVIVPSKEFIRTNNCGLVEPVMCLSEVFQIIP